jgi:hypothetical protein
VKEALRGGKPEEQIESQPDPERGLPPAYGEVSIEGRSLMDEPKKEEAEINPTLARTGRDHLSEPNSMQANRSNGFPGKTERPSVREKLEAYKAEIVLEKREKAKDLVSKGLDAARDAARAVPIPKAPGKER